MGWIHGTNGRGIVFEERENTETKIGGIHKERFGGSGCECRMRAREGVNLDGW